MPIAALLNAPLAPRQAEDAASWRDVAPSVLALHEKLLASPSATAVLRQMFGDPVQIQRVPGAAQPPSIAQCAMLDVADAAEVVHRRVVLIAGGQAVSDADIWYVPARLWAGMAESLLTTATPFGTVVAPMQPSRRTVAARICPAGETHSLEHEAVLLDAAGVPIAVVFERYRAAKS